MHDAQAIRTKDSCRCQVLVCILDGLLVNLEIGEPFAVTANDNKHQPLLEMEPTFADTVTD